MESENLSVGAVLGKLTAEELSFQKAGEHLDDIMDDFHKTFTVLNNVFWRMVKKRIGTKPGTQVEIDNDGVIRVTSVDHFIDHHKEEFIDLLKKEILILNDPID